MDEEEAERDRLLSMLFFLVANALASAKAATKTAAQRLDIVLRPYKGIQNQADDAETALIKGLLGDLRKEENTEAVTALNLEPTLTSLEATNNAFDQAKNRRAEEKPTTRLTRRKTDGRKRIRQAKRKRRLRCARRPTACIRISARWCMLQP